MSRRDSTDALVALIVGLAVAISVAIVVHYLARAWDWWRYVTDDPELYALTEGEHMMFVISAWAFTVETTLLAAGIAMLALGPLAGVVIGVAVCAALIALTVSLLSGGASAPSGDWEEHDEFYDLGGFYDIDVEE